jgi:hypothetical protein
VLYAVGLGYALLHSDRYMLGLLPSFLPNWGFVLYTSCLLYASFVLGLHPFCFLLKLVYLYIYIKGASVFLEELVLLPSSNYARSGSIVHRVAPMSGQQSM